MKIIFVYLGHFFPVNKIDKIFIEVKNNIENNNSLKNKQISNESP